MEISVHQNIADYCFVCSDFWENTMVFQHTHTHTTAPPAGENSVNTLRMFHVFKGQ